MNNMKKKQTSSGPRDFVEDAFGNQIRPGDKVVWMSPISNSMELTTVESIANASMVRCYIFVDRLGNPDPDELTKYSKYRKNLYTRTISTWKVCGAKSFPKRNSNVPVV